MEDDMFLKMVETGAVVAGSVFTAAGILFALFREDILERLKPHKVAPRWCREQPHTFRSPGMLENFRVLLEICNEGARDLEHVVVWIQDIRSPEGCQPVGFVPPALNWVESGEYIAPYLPARSSQFVKLGEFSSFEGGGIAGHLSLDRLNFPFEGVKGDVRWTVRLQVVAKGGVVYDGWLQMMLPKFVSGWDSILEITVGSTK